MAKKKNSTRVGQKYRRWPWYASEIGQAGQKYHKWLKQFEPWLASDIGQKTIGNNLNELANLMGVPEENRERFCSETWWSLNYAVGGALTMQLGYKDGALADAELKVRAAEKAVSKLCEAKEKYSEFNLGSDDTPETLEDCKRALTGMVGAFAAMTNSYYRDIPDSGQGSRDLRKNWLFETFVSVLFIESENNGKRLTFSHHNGTGTIFRALDLVRPFFPPDFMPRAPLNAIRRAKEEVKRIKNRKAEFTNLN